ncbi:MAG: protein-L-isoaspartate(D-aspartate) O-methyltransferase, partial [Candidatus Kapabacteria bacterium]|nr:protein-L-isoaspartate(D-aspartate) O-methyltransferase [Candidatus Kapabacteria bacterium]MDW7996874.1 protein-L-isoaspartate(D-aspartate) O-methyltransferase [Bacteroidota bacterium]
MTLPSSQWVEPYGELRRALIEHLRRRGIRDERVLAAMERLPRELFVHPAFIHRAYEDAALPLGYNQTISQPYTVAFMTSLLEVQPGDAVLEVGTGSGYQAALLALMGARVYTVERQCELYQRARQLFARLGLSIQTCLGDGSLGWQEHAPYDGIIVTAAAPHVPKPLMEQLALGGRLVIPVGGPQSQVLVRMRRISEQDYDYEEFGEFRFVPLIGKEGWREAPEIHP